MLPIAPSVPDPQSRTCSLAALAAAAAGAASSNGSTSAGARGGALRKRTKALLEQRSADGDVVLAVEVRACARASAGVALGAGASYGVYKKINE